jgi:peptidoglycan hydrolase FlgJ
MSPIAKLDAQTAGMQAAENDLVQRKLSLDKVRKNVAPGPDQDKKLREACKGFESMFINKMWSEMKATVHKEGYLHSKEEQAYMGMFDQELSKKLADSGGMGLGDMLYAHLHERLSKASDATLARAGEAPAIRPLHPDPEPLPLASATQLKGTGQSEGLPLSAADQAKAQAASTRAEQEASEHLAQAAPGIVLPPDFYGPAPQPASTPSDMDALAHALDLARKVEEGLAAERAAKPAYRDAAPGETPVILPPAATVSRLDHADPEGGDESEL